MCSQTFSCFPRKSQKDRGFSFLSNFQKRAQQQFQSARLNLFHFPTGKAQLKIHFQSCQRPSGFLFFASCPICSRNKFQKPSLQSQAKRHLLLIPCLSMRLRARASKEDKALSLQSKMLLSERTAKLELIFLRENIFQAGAGPLQEKCPAEKKLLACRAKYNLLSAREQPAELYHNPQKEKLA